MQTFPIHGSQTYSTAVVTCSQRAEGLPFKPSQGQILIMADSAAISVCPTDGVKCCNPAWGGRTENIGTDQTENESRQQPDTENNRERNQTGVAFKPRWLTELNFIRLQSQVRVPVCTYSEEIIHRLQRQQVSIRRPSAVQAGSRIYSVPFWRRKVWVQIVF